MKKLHRMLNLFQHPTGQVDAQISRRLSKCGVETN